ncbi:MAG TPA: PEPxxWA-CTERM sorting domain-containing protein [Caulobacteraceae bacterium]
MRFTNTLTIAAAAVITVTGASASTLYSQPFDGTNNVFASQNDTGGFGNFATTYDDFHLGSAADITTVDFTGSYFNPPSQGTITAFTLNIYADNAGQPGTLLYSANVSGTGNETFLGNFGDPTYTYSVPTNFNAAAGTTYWLSVVPDLGFPPQWGWNTATGGDNLGWQDFFGTRSQNGSDFAFTLLGGVPEPASWALMLCGFASLGAALRSRRRIAAA